MRIGPLEKEHGLVFKSGGSAVGATQQAVVVGGQALKDLLGKTFFEEQAKRLDLAFGFNLDTVGLGVVQDEVRAVVQAVMPATCPVPGFTLHKRF